MSGRHLRNIDGAYFAEFHRPITELSKAVGSAIAAVESVERSTGATARTR